MMQKREAGTKAATPAPAKFAIWKFFSNLLMPRQPSKRNAFAGCSR
jgi:hypothetical protein